MESIYLKIAALSGAAAVAIGAFGAHGLKARVEPAMLEIYETGVRYHFYHTLALLAVAAAFPGLWQSRWTHYACASWIIGMLIFSGSLYLLVLTGVTKLGAITPIGGVALIMGWCFLFAATFSMRPQ